MSRLRTALSAGLLLALLSGGAGCGRAERDGPVLLIGVDGFEWDVCLPLLRAGRMPHLAALMERGSFGLLETSLPTSSPVIWTTIATGKPREEHGIRGFSKPARKQRPRELFTNKDRRTKAFWNVASDYGRRVGVVGWWMTSPVEPVHGIMVAQTNTVDQLRVARGENVWKGALLPGESGQVYPPEREDEVLAVLAETERDLDQDLAEIFGTFRHPLSVLGQRLWDNCRWSFRADLTYARIAEELLRGERFDLFAVYFGGPDVVGHRFWRYREPERYAHRPTPVELEDFGTVIDDYYVHVDDLIGRLVAAAGPGADVLVLSDHGMHPVNETARFDPDDPPVDVNSGNHLDAPPGMIVGAGPDLRRRAGGPAVGALRRSDLERVASVMDVAETVLWLLDLPVGADMRGEPARGLLAEEFLATHELSTVPTHDTEAWRAAHAALAPVGAEDAERLQQLRDLGYVGDEGDLVPEPAGDPGNAEEGGGEG